MAKRFELWVRITYLKKHFNLQATTLERRGVKTRRRGKAVEYELGSVVDLNSDLISKHLNRSDSSDQRLRNDADNEKGLQELRKLRLGNAAKTGETVSVADLEVMISGLSRTITDRLEGIQTKVKMGVLDFPPVHMVAIQKAIIQKRNEAANHG